MGTVYRKRLPETAPVPDPGATLNDLNNKFTDAAFGELLVAELSVRAAWRFDYGVNTRMITKTEANSGTVTMDGGRAKLTTSTNTAGSAMINTKNLLRYMPGIGGLARFTAVFATGTASSQQLIGIGDANDGFFFGFNGVSFGIMRRRGASDTWTPQESWNGDALGETLNTSLGNIYQIRYQWLGYGLIRFYIFDKSVRTFVMVHVIEYPNTSADTHILNPTLPLFAHIKNTGNNTSLSMYTPSAMAALEGTDQQAGLDALQIPNVWDLTAAFANTNNNHFVSIQNKTTLNSVTNKVPVQISSVEIARDATAGTGTLRFYRAATTAGALTFADVDATNSPVSTSATTTTITGGTLERSYLISASQTRTITFVPGELVLQPGEILTIGIQNSAAPSVTYVATINWTELF